MKKILIINCLILLFSCASNLTGVYNSDAFVDDEMNLTQQLSINQSDTLTKFHLVGIDPSIKADDRVMYTWFKSSKLKRTQGGYSGQLLNGPFEQHVGGTMIVQGRYKNGVKEGVWKTWEPTGKLLTIHEYRFGRVTGIYKLFIPPGILKEEGSMKNGIRDGRVTYYFPEDSTVTIKYEAGTPVDTVKFKLPWK